MFPQHNSGGMLQRQQFVTQLESFGAFRRFYPQHIVAKLGSKHGQCMWIVFAV